MMGVSGYRLRTDPKIQLAHLGGRDADNAFPGLESVVGRGQPLVQHGLLDVN
jgi:hypothetical protein